MHAMIDGDLLAYEFGHVTDPNGYPAPWSFVASRVNTRIEKILDAVGATSYCIFLTSEDKSNFREKVATIKPYKGHRTSPKPFWKDKIRQHLVQARRAEIVFGIEADDALGISQAEDTVICSRDKDLHMIPGYHYTWPCGAQNEKPLWIQDELGALRCFYSQLVTGDSTDNIPGLFGVGPNSSLVRNINSASNELAMYEIAQRAYEQRFGSYWRMFLEENARLLWILRTSDTEEILKRLQPLHSALSWKKELQKALRRME